jgi:type I restriction enzyme, S subunit
VSALEDIAPCWESQRARFLFHDIHERGHDLPLASVTRDGGVEFRADLANSVWNPGEDVSNYKRVVPGDFVIGLRSFQSGLGCSPLEGLVSPAYSVLRPRRLDMDTGFFRHLLKSHVVVSRLENIAQGIRQGRTIAVEDFNELLLPLPPLSAQRRIADYLDRETARIDALIRAKRRLVVLLDERWRAIVRHLTRVGAGDRNLVQLRRVARLQAGAAFPHENQGDAGGTIPYVKVGDLGHVDAQDQLSDPSNRIAPDVAITLRSPVLPAGTIVLPKIGAALLTNRRAILSESSCLDQNVMGVTVHTGMARFVYYCLESIDLGNLSTPGPVPLLNEEAALSVRIPWPSIDEQESIVLALDAQKSATKSVTDAVIRQLNVLEERRTALITAAVAGQLDIPEAA